MYWVWNIVSMGLKNDWSMVYLRFKNRIKSLSWPPDWNNSNNSPSMLVRLSRRTWVMKEETEGCFRILGISWVYKAMEMELTCLSLSQGTFVLNYWPMHKRRTRLLWGVSLFGSYHGQPRAEVCVICLLVYFDFFFMH
ncbi:hypothetical protein GLYMA_02G277750v4 [Glycine max]|nr:hypothetical protein GLYMA_02G277750v4 [Glycine max]KAH1062446.1 hypothetical protein GYH30_005430 [Glycine max]